MLPPPSTYERMLLKFYPDNAWSCRDTYDTLEWYDTTMPKPTEEELELKYDDLLVDEMREERNRLLKECDYTALPDYPHREAWLSYRQQLRDFPAIWIPDMEWPQPPT